jgi:hypothetical protein
MNMIEAHASDTLKIQVKKLRAKSQVPGQEMSALVMSAYAEKVGNEKTVAVRPIGVDNNVRIAITNILSVVTIPVGDKGIRVSKDTTNIICSKDNISAFIDGLSGVKTPGDLVALVKSVKQSDIKRV